MADVLVIALAGVIVVQSLAMRVLVRRALHCGFKDGWDRGWNASGRMGLRGRRGEFKVDD